MPEPSLLVREMLPLAVSLGDFRMGLPASFPVAAVAGPPFLQAVAADLTVFGIGGKPAPVIVAAAPPPASRI
jgi:hypothetical protein